MNFFIRWIETSKWVPSTLDWLEDDDIEADPISDLGTKNNALSIFSVEDTSYAPRVIAALVAQLYTPKNVGYYVISPDLLEGLQFNLKNNSGQTPDKQVNKWHRDIIQLSGKKLVLLAKTLRAECDYIEMFEDDWINAIKESYDAGYLQEKHINIKDKMVRNRIGIPISDE